MLNGYEVYELVDPDTNEVRYVGMTECGPSRLAGHIAEAKAAQGRDDLNEKQAWLLDVLARGKQPVFRVRFHVRDKAHAAWVERALQGKHAKTGSRLTNGAVGAAPIETCPVLLGATLEYMLNDLGKQVWALRQALKSESNSGITAAVWRLRALHTTVSRAVFVDVSGDQDEKTADGEDEGFKFNAEEDQLEAANRRVAIERVLEVLLTSLPDEGRQAIARSLAYLLEADGYVVSPAIAELRSQPRND